MPTTVLMRDGIAPADLLPLAVREAEEARAAGCLPIGAVLVGDDGRVLGAGRAGGAGGREFLIHAETSAVRAAGPIGDYAATTLVTTMTPCWYCAGLVRFLGIGAVIVGDSDSWSGEALDWLADSGVSTTRLHDRACLAMFQRWAADHGGWSHLPDSAAGRPVA